MAYTKFVGDVNAELNLIKASKPNEDDGSPVIKPKYNLRFEENLMQNEEQHEMLKKLEEKKKEGNI